LKGTHNKLSVIKKKASYSDITCETQRYHMWDTVISHVRHNKYHMWDTTIPHVRHNNITRETQRYHMRKTISHVIHNDITCETQW